jgi:DNA-binding transcriptional ArsR family regulator
MRPDSEVGADTTDAAGEHDSSAHSRSRPPEEGNREGTGETDGLIKIWQQQEPKARTSVVADLIFDRAVNMLYGDGGQGKSYLALLLCQHTLLGMPFAKRDVLQRDKVLYVDGELDAEEFTSRSYKIARGLGLDKPPEGLYYYQLPGALSDAAVQGRVSLLCKGLEPGLIVLDSLTMSTYSDDPTDAAPVIKVIKYLETLGTVVAIDHIRNPQPGVNVSQYRAFGSVFKYNGCRSVVQIVKADGGGIAFIHKKANFGKQGAPIYLKPCFEDDSVKYESVDASHEALSGVDDNLPAIERVYRELCARVGRGGAKADELAEALDLKPKTVSNHLSALKTAGRATNSNGMWTPC